VGYYYPPLQENALKKIMDMNIIMLPIGVKFRNKNFIKNKIPIAL
jgi:hypothetical protein